MRVLFFLINITIFSHILIAQQKNIDFTKINFKSDPTGLKNALKHIKSGNAEYSKSNYNLALNNYLLSNKFNPYNAELNAKIGDCYLNFSDKINAKKYLTKAFALSNKIDGYYFFKMGVAFQMNNDFNNAIKYYKFSKSKKTKIDSKYLVDIDNKIKECNYAIELLKTPVKVDIILLNENVNSENEEYVPVITADESELFFTSRRPNTTGGKTDKKLFDYYEDIYYSKKVNGNWTKAENIGTPINSDLHDATIGLSLDGQKLFLYRSNKRGVGNIYISERNGNKWDEPKMLPKPINSKYKETSACFAPDGNTIYFVSNRPNGLGGKDIYKATKDENGVWGEEKNLGNIVNTEKDEDAVFLHPDGKTLYFSSKGHSTMGGYDIFKTIYTNGKWSTPENIGYPINTSDDDVCFVLTASGEYGYYTSINNKSKRDIYQIKFTEEINKPKLILLKGIVTDRKTNELLESSIEIYDNNQNKLIGHFKSNSSTGKFLVSLPAGRNYGITVKKKGYLLYSENFDIQANASFQNIEKIVPLDVIEVGNKVILNNIFYDYNKSNLRVSSLNELNKIYNLLKSNSNIELEISAHTDSRGSNAFNDKLSQARAESCVNYLVEKGIRKDRLIAKGYGEKKPIINNNQIDLLNTEQEKEKAHQKNRRTEFKIIKD